MATNWIDHFLTRTGEKSVRAMAEKTNLDASTLNRQLGGTTALRVETVVAICRAYDLDIAQTFVAVGFITAEEAKSFGASMTLADVSDVEISKEIVRRVLAGKAGPALMEPSPDSLIEDVVRETKGVPES